MAVTFYSSRIAKERDQLCHSNDEAAAKMVKRLNMLKSKAYLSPSSKIPRGSSSSLETMAVAGRPRSRLD